MRSHANAAATASPLAMRRCMHALATCAIALCLPRSISAAAAAAAAADADFALSAGFTSDAVLQRAPAKAAVYGLTASVGAVVKLTVSDDSGTSAPYTVTATVTPPASAAAPPLQPGSGTANPLCMQRCLEAGHCCMGDISGDQIPSCAMGCILAGRTVSSAKCKQSCDAAGAASSGCTFTVVSPAGPHHLPADTTQNATPWAALSASLLRAPLRIV